MHEVALRGGSLAALRKQANFIPHAGVAQTRNANPRLHRLWKRQRLKVVAMGFDHQADGVTVVNVQHALLDQPGVDGGVKPAVIDNVVDMAVGIVVGPAGGDGAKHLVGAAPVGLGFD